MFANQGILLHFCMNSNLEIILHQSLLKFLKCITSMCKMYLVSIEIVNWFENTLIIGGEKNYPRYIIIIKKNYQVHNPYKKHVLVCV